MSRLEASITDIQSEDSLHIITCAFETTNISLVTLELNQNLHIGSKIVLGIKPTHIAIGKEKIDMISYTNQIKTTIDSIDEGKLLSSISLITNNNQTLESIITTNSLKRLNLQKGDKVVAFIKASEISIMEVLS